MKNLEQEIFRLLLEQIQHHTDTLCNPGSVKTFDEYQSILGRIIGLKEAAELVDQAISEVNKSRGN